MWYKICLSTIIQVAQTRLEARTHRPEKEACRDAPFHGLCNEVKELNNSIRQLNGKVNIENTLHSKTNSRPFCYHNSKKYIIYFMRKYGKVNGVHLFSQKGYCFNRIDISFQLAQAEDCHQELLKNKSKLEHDIKVKANSLFIDSEGCLSCRKNFPVVRLQPSCDILVKQLIS